MTELAESDSPTEPEIVETQGWGKRLINTIIAPEKSFEIIRDHKSRIWLLTALLVIIAVAFPQTIIIQRTIAQFKATGPELPPGIELTEEEIAQVQASTPAFTFWLGLIGIIIGLILVWLIWAGIILLFVSMFGGRTEFGKLWRLTIWASIPIAIQSILSGIYLLIAGGIQPLLTSAASFMTNPAAALLAPSSPEDFASFTPPTGGSLALFSLASWVDPFYIWRLLLLILGVMIIAKINWRKSIAIVLIPWLLGILIMAGIAGLTGSLAF